MGICYGKVGVPEVPILQPQEQENNGGASNEDDKCRIGESPSVDRINKPSPFPFYSPSPANSNFHNSPANSTPQLFFKRLFPPPSPAKHIKVALARQKGAVKPNEVAIPKGSENKGVVLDKSFGFNKNFSSKYDLDYDVGHGHFGHTCFAKSRKGELKGQSVAIKIISKAKILHFMANADMFKDATIEEDEHNKALQEATDAMKGNNVPKGVVSLEKLYDL